MPPSPDTEQPEDAFARVHESWWVVVPFVLVGLIVAGHVFTYEWSPDYQRPEWLKGVKVREVDRALFINASILAAMVLIFGVVDRLSKLPRWVRRLRKVVLVTLVVVNGFTYFYVRRTTIGRWWHCYDAYHYALNPMFQGELGYDKLYACTVEASPRNKVWDKTVVRDLSTYGFTKAKKIRESEGPACRASMEPERWEEFDASVDMFLDNKRCGAGRVRSALGDQGYNGTPFHTAMIRAFFSVVSFDRLGLTWLALLDVFGLLVAHAFMTRAVGWRYGYVFSVFAFTLSVDRYAIIGGSSFRFLWLALLIIAVACLVKRRWAAAAACLTVSAMLTVFPLLFGVGALIALAGRAYRRHEARADLRRFVLSGLLTSALCGGFSVAASAGPSQYADFMHDMKIHSEGPPNSKLGGRLEKTPGYGVGLKFVFTYRGENGKPHVGYNRVKLTKEFARVEPVYRAIGWGLTGIAAVLAFSLAPAEAAVMFGFIAFYSLLGTVGYYFSCASLVCVACLFAHRRASGTFMFLLFLLTSVVGLHHAASDIYTKESLYRTLTSMSWGIWIVAWLVWTAARTGLMRISEERPPP